MKSKNMFNDVFLLSWIKFSLVIILFIISVFLHNLVSALLGIEEAVFFIISVFIIPIYLVICIIYSLIYHIKNKKKRRKK